MIASLKAIFKNEGRPTWCLAVRETTLIFVTYLVYSLSKNIIDPTPILRAFGNAWDVVALERSLGLAHEATIQVWASAYSMGFIAFLAYLYAVGLWVALIGSAVLLFAFKRDLYWQLRTVFLITMYTAVVVFALYPLAPPRMLPGYGMTDVVVMLGLNPVEDSKSIFGYNKFAAMPSLHIAWSSLVMLAWWRAGWGTGKIIAATYLFFMTLAVIATANHYVLDVVAGVALLGFALWLVKLPSKLKGFVQERDLRHIKLSLPMPYPESGFYAGYHNPMGRGMPAPASRIFVASSAWAELK
jgi:hypothetical protein